MSINEHRTNVTSTAQKSVPLIFTHNVPFNYENMGFQEIVSICVAQMYEVNLLTKDIFFYLFFPIVKDSFDFI